MNYFKDNDWKMSLVDTCMDKIFGVRWYINECVEDDAEMDAVYKELMETMANLPIDATTLIAMVVRENNGLIKFKKPYKFRDMEITYIANDEEGYTFFGNDDMLEPIYIKDEMNWNDTQKFLQYLTGHADDDEKASYLNSIFFTLKNHQARPCYDFDWDGDPVITDDEGREIEVRRVFITTDYKNKELVGINYTIKGEGDDLNFNFLLNFDLDFIKQLFKVFTEQIYGKDNYGQIVDFN